MRLTRLANTQEIDILVHNYVGVSYNGVGEAPNRRNKDVTRLCATRRKHIVRHPFLSTLPTQEGDVGDGGTPSAEMW
ncbi:hypothetical protein CH267_22205 [Rhodococcus sp. 06-621-2]|nr:hypothetical protein CH267_22205 [Rhodococcus sp. 06-621-2]